MVFVKGMIIRCSSLIPEISEAVFQRLACGYFSDPINVDRGRVNEPKRCGRQECLAVNSMILIHNRSRFAEKESLDNAVVSCNLFILSSQNGGVKSAFICRFAGIEYLEFKPSVVAAAVSISAIRETNLDKSTKDHISHEDKSKTSKDSVESSENDVQVLGGLWLYASVTQYF
ncbi:hypothetical protein GIB67_032279 [Kingdonia uniflora]|uniref:DNA helicase n=1 Tax=Kingdonia uniflora TaxID=39325 RepID=A0A7J7MXT9_9MAGN|nr:hypothetical protein GIB67_032279 [Kingdonia uniflora]